MGQSETTSNRRFRLYIIDSVEHWLYDGRPFVATSGQQGFDSIDRAHTSPYSHPAPHVLKLARLFTPRSILSIRIWG